MVFDTVSAPARTPARIAFTGLSGCGKDSAAQPLLARGYQRACFGDVIKGIFDAQCRELLGFSAFTEHRPDKEKIRPLLVHGGDVFYDEVERRFFGNLPPRCVNTRLLRIREAKQWRALGGVIVEIHRPGLRPAEPEEAAALACLRGFGFLDYTVGNTGTLADLHAAITSLFP